MSTANSAAIKDKLIGDVQGIVAQTKVLFQELVARRYDLTDEDAAAIIIEATAVVDTLEPLANAVEAMYEDIDDKIEEGQLA